MFSRDTTIRQAFGILHSSLFFIFLGVLLETPIIASYISLSFRQSLWGVALGWLLAGINLVYYSGLFGVFLEIASGEELVFSLAKFKANAKKNFKIYLPVAIAPVVIHFLFFVFFPANAISLKMVMVYNHLVFSFILVAGLSVFKYLRPLSLPWRRVPVSWQEGAGLLLIFAAGLLLYHVPWSDFRQLREDWIAALLFKYFHVLGFLILAKIFVSAYPEIGKKFQHDRELYLISPVTAGVFTSWAFAAFKTHPSWFPVLQALTPPEYGIRELNRVAWNSRYWASGKLVAISCFSCNSAEAYKIAKGYRERGSTVIMGGPHVTNVPDEALEFCDSVVLGEAEGVWPQVIKDYEQGCLKKKYYPQEDPQAFEKIHHFMLQSPPETLRDCLETVRGCKYNCYFCAVPGIGAACLRKKPVEEVVELVKRIQGTTRGFVFLDNNIYADPAYSRQLFEALRPLKLQWHSASSLDIGQNEAILKLAKQSGCSTLLLGYEITPDSGEKKEGGKFAMAQRYVALTRNIHKAGIEVKAQFIIGFDSDDWFSWIRLLRFCFRIWPRYSSLSILTPYPGTRFFNDVLAQERITTLNWRNYNCVELVFKPRRIPPMLLGQPFFTVMIVSFLLFPSRSAWILWLNIFLVFYFGLK